MYNPVLKDPPQIVRNRIRRIARRAGIEHLLGPRILHVLKLESLDKAKPEELEAIESMLQIVSLYEPVWGRPGQPDAEYPREGVPPFS